MDTAGWLRTPTLAMPTVTVYPIAATVTVTVPYLPTIPTIQYTNVIYVAYAILAAAAVYPSLILGRYIFAILVQTILLYALLVNRLLRTTRTRALPLFRKHVLPRILAIVVSHLSRRELVRCCRVSRLFFEVAGKELYGCDAGLLAAKEQYYGCYAEPNIPSSRQFPVSIQNSPSILVGIDRASAYDTSVPVFPQFLARLITIFLRPFPYPLPPSRLKRGLLRHVRHLTYGMDIFRDNTHARVDSRDLFPSLHTLTIPSIHYIDWEPPLLANLRPEHIRLTLIRSFMSGFGNPKYLFNSPLGSQTEKITLHFVDCQMPKPGSDRVIEIDWPETMKELDLVFFAPTPSSTLPHHSFARIQTPVMGLAETCRAATAVAAVLASASAIASCQRIRIIGLGKEVTTARELLAVAQKVLNGEMDAEDQGSMFTFFLMGEYDKLLRERVEGEEELWGKQASRLAARLRYVTPEEYLREKDCPPF